MLDNLVKKMIIQGATSQEVVQAAVKLSRDVYQHLLALEAQLDQAFGSPSFRQSSVEPLVQKSRQIEAIRSRMRQGGTLRTSDTDSLQALLNRRLAEYESLNDTFPWETLALGQRNLVKTYIHGRREHLELGDVERVQSAIRDALCTAAIAC